MSCLIPPPMALAYVFESLSQKSCVSKNSDFHYQEMRLEQNRRSIFSKMRSRVVRIYVSTYLST